LNILDGIAFAISVKNHGNKQGGITPGEIELQKRAHSPQITAGTFNLAQTLLSKAIV
jgi:hypothetical protein